MSNRGYILYEDRANSDCTSNWLGLECSDELFLHKFQRHSVHAVSQSSWSWPILKNVAQVRLAPSTQYFRAGR